MSILLGLIVGVPTALVAVGMYFLFKENFKSVFGGIAIWLLIGTLIGLGTLSIAFLSGPR